jgi:hypothetical protein
VDESVKVGQQVKLLYSLARGTVLEIDNVYQAARIELNFGGFEVWQPLDELEIVEPWNNRRRTA